MYNFICDIFGTITTLDVSALIAFAIMILMIVSYNNKRLKEKADRVELEKLEQDINEEIKDIMKTNEEQHKAIRDNYLENIKQVNVTMDEISKTQHDILQKILKIK